MKFPLTPGQERHWRLLQFLGRLALFSLPVYLVVALAADLSALQLAVAGNAAWLLGAAGGQVAQQGTLVAGEGFMFTVGPDCTGWKSMLLLSGLLFAVPGIAFRKRLLGLAIGLPAVWGANLLRIATSARAQALWGPEAAQAFHDWWWQLGLSITVLGIWLLWLKLLRPDDAPPKQHKAFTETKDLTKANKL